MELSIQVLDFALEMGYNPCEGRNVRLLGCQVVGMLRHLIHESNFGVSEVGHFHLVLLYSLGKFREILLYPNQVVGSIATRSTACWRYQGLD